MTFSNDDICCAEPNHNRPLSVSVEHRNKLIQRALVDQGSCINIIPIVILQELGYGKEHLVLDNVLVISVSHVSTDSLGCLSLILQLGHSVCLMSFTLWTLIQSGICSLGDL